MSNTSNRIADKFSWEDGDVEIVGDDEETGSKEERREGLIALALKGMRLALRETEKSESSE